MIRKRASNGKNGKKQIKIFIASAHPEDKDKTEAFGRSLVDLLNRAGATFVRKEFCAFVRSPSKPIIEDEKP